MFHACLVSTLICFVYTLRYFYTLSGTNLLTRCHSASCMLSSVFGSRKGRKSIFSKLDGTKVKVIIFSGATRNHKAELEEGTRVAAPPLGAGQPWWRLQGCEPPGPPSTLPPSPIRIPW